jgi:hypothetical protein
MCHVSSFHNVSMGQLYTCNYLSPSWVHVSYIAMFNVSKYGHLVYTWYDEIGVRAQSIDVNIVSLIIDIIGMVYVICFFKMLGIFNSSLLDLLHLNSTDGFWNCSPHENVVHQFDDLIASNIGSVHNMVVYFIEMGPTLICVVRRTQVEALNCVSDTQFRYKLFPQCGQLCTSTWSFIVLLQRQNKNKMKLISHGDKISTFNVVHCKGGGLRDEERSNDICDSKHIYMLWFTCSQYHFPCNVIAIPYKISDKLVGWDIRHFYLTQNKHFVATITCFKNSQMYKCVT